MIYSEKSADSELISHILGDAFAPSENEAKLVQLLRKTPRFNSKLSLLIKNESETVGYILFYPLLLVTNATKIETLGLVPLGILKRYQKQGFGSALVKEGLRRAAKSYLSVFVVGSQEYYGKFGFHPVKGINNNLGFSQEHFLGLELATGSLENIQGTVMYPSEFQIVA